MSLTEKMYLHYLINKFENRYAVNILHNKQIESILNFETSQKTISIIYLESILAKKRLLQILDSDQVNLEEFQEASQNLLNKRNQLEEHLGDISFSQLEDNIISIIV